jgi:site-specific DNA-methyltransferase (adenine-specific)
MELFHGDIFKVIKQIKKNSIDEIIIDPPYGSTPLEWDIQFDFSSLWPELKRILKNNGVILIFGQEPFSSYVRISNIEYYKYDWYWVKERLTNVFQVKKRPGKVVENISVFYKDSCKYFPQKRKHDGKLVSNKIGDKAKWSTTIGGKKPKSKPIEYKDDGFRHPTQILNFNRDNIRKLIHPTQKPLELIEYLVKTYTKECDVVLDPCMGSGTTGVACNNLNRKFIGVEINDEFFNKAMCRIHDNNFENNLI